MKKLICCLLCAMLIFGCGANSSMAVQASSSPKNLASSKSMPSDYSQVKEAITQADDRLEIGLPTLGITLWEYLAFMDEELHDLNVKRLSEYTHTIYPSPYQKTADIVYYLSNDIDIMFTINQANSEIIQITVHSWSGAANFRSSKTIGQITGRTMKVFESGKGDQLINEIHLYDRNLKKGDAYEAKGDNYIYQVGYSDARMIFVIYAK